MDNRGRSVYICMEEGTIFSCGCQMAYMQMTNLIISAMHTCVLCMYHVVHAKQNEHTL